MTDTTTADAPTMNRRQAAKVRTTAKVLEAARGLFATAGYEKATIRDIAKAAGMSTGAVFANYQDKAALYTAAYGHAPIGPEMGRAAMKALRALCVDLDGENGTSDLVDQMAAVDRLRAHAESILQTVGFPPLPQDAWRDPQEHALVDVVQAALESRL